MRVTPPRKSYSPEFIEDAVAHVRRSDKTFKQIADDLGVPYWTLRGWYKRSEMAKRKAKPKVRVLTADESADEKLARLERENEKLRRENESLKMDREILKKAAAFFAKESE